MREHINSFKTPKPLGINKRVTVFGLGALLFIILFLVVSSLTSPDPVTEKKRAQLGSNQFTEVISSLPKDYNNWKSEKRESLNYEQSDLDKFLEAEKLKRMKRAIKARESDLFIENVKIDKKAISVARRESSKAIHSDRDAFNRQDDKENFLNKNRKEETFLNSRLQEKRSSFELMAGSLIPGILLTGLNSDLPGEILGQVSRNVFDTVSGKHLLIPQGTKILGKYDSRISYGQERVLIVWTRLMFPNGDSLVLEGMPGIDLSGYAGLKDKVNNHWGRLLSGVVLGSVLGASAQIASGGNRTLNPSFGQLALEGAAQNLNQAGQQITRRNLNVQPTLEVRPGSRFHIFVTKDIELRR